MVKLNALREGFRITFSRFLKDTKQLVLHYKTVTVGTGRHKSERQTAASLEGSLTIYMAGVHPALVYPSQDVRFALSIRRRLCRYIDPVSGWYKTICVRS